jgi:hypothetical protein
MPRTTTKYYFQSVATSTLTGSRVVQQHAIDARGLSGISSQNWIEGLAAQLSCEFDDRWEVSIMQITEFEYEAFRRQAE